ncbi:MAG: polysaccharide deacetylase family protein [Clostridia bacterium]|nr:polysaccharide deacetylase family protein [Clostridia bacterium]
MKKTLLRLIAFVGVMIMLTGVFGCNTEKPIEVPTAVPEATAAPEVTAEPSDTAPEGIVPTEEPTEEPVIEPTGEPTEEPTEEVTEAPTEAPTAAPTDAPTAAPTATPTPTPTPAPTDPPSTGYKKYFTMSFDDGTVQDVRIIEILKKYNMPCTFNINTGRFGQVWTWVGEPYGKPNVHTCLTRAQVQSGLYKGFDVEVHTLTHPDLAANYVNYGKNNVINEVKKDAENIAALTGIKPVGMAYPGGQEANTSDEVIRTILENTGVRFARMAVNQKRPSQFALPEYWMKWYPTTAFGNGFSTVNSYAKKFIAAEPTDRDLLFYVWGHGFEFDLNNTWDEFEAFIKMMSEQEGIEFVTNAEFYEIFKDQIPSWKD